MLRKNMVTIGAFEAKTKLSELLERVSKGESFVITKHGQPVAKLVPTNKNVEPKRKMTAEEIIEGFRKIRERVKPGPSLQEILKESKRSVKY